MGFGEGSLAGRSRPQPAAKAPWSVDSLEPAFTLQHQDRAETFRSCIRDRK
jgi:hypothetical protein